MELTDAQLAFTADTDSTLKVLRADLRATINTTEHEMRLSIAEMLIKITPHLMPGAGDGLESLAVEVPANLIKSMTPFFQGYSLMMDQVEAHQAAIASARNANLN